MIVSAVASLLMLSSCLDGDDSETIVTNFYNPIVTEFKLEDNSNVANNLSKYKFTIDNYGTSDAAIHAKFPKDGIIFNADSLPYGTIADSIKVTMGFTSPDSAFFCLYSLDGILRQYSNVAFDSALYFASFPDARLNLSARGNRKVYHVKINVHKVASDSIKWNAITDELWGNTAISDQCTDTIGTTLFWYIESNGGNQVISADLKTSVKDWSDPAEVSVETNEQLDLQTLYNWHGALYAIGKTSGKLLTSTDGYNWEISSDEYQFAAILGNQLSTTDVYGKWNSDTLNAIVCVDGAYCFAVSADAKAWRLDKEIPQGFPVRGFTRPISVAARAKNGNLTSRLYVMGGKTADGSLTASTWSCDGWSETDKSCNWAEFPHQNMEAFEQGTIIEYTLDQDKPKSFWLLSPGFRSDNSIDQATHYGRKYATLYYSEDSGVSWHVLFNAYPKLADNALLADIVPSSGICNPDNYEIFYFGGKTSDGTFRTQIWKGLLPSLNFKKVR